MPKLGIIALLAVLGGCAPVAGNRSPSPVSMANPASVYCQQIGGKLAIENTPAGQIGMCALPDGSKVEEWALFKAASQCGADSRQSLVGTPAVDLDPSTLPELSRVIRHNAAVTMDFRQDRLNVYVDETGKIDKVACG